MPEPRPDPSPWIVRWAALIPPGRSVLDLACGLGRHTRYFLQRGHPVVAVDRDLGGIADLQDRADLETLEVDLEDGRSFPLDGRRFGCVVVTNYLWRPLLVPLVDAVEEGGALLYETFAVGHERYGPPSNPDYLLRPGELLDAVGGRLAVRAFEDVTVAGPRPATVQRIAAVRED